MKEWHYWRNLLLFTMVVLIVGMIITGLYWTRRMALAYLHPPRTSQPSGDTLDKQGIVYEEVSLITSDGIKLATSYTPPQNDAVILVAHGRSGYFAEMHVLFARNGYGVVSWDFRAQGDSEGELSTLGYYEALDVEAALDFALSQSGVKRIGAWGGSMGGAATILAAARRPEIEAVVVDSTFATLEDELEKVISVPVLRPLIRFFAELEAGISLHDIRPVDQIGHISPRSIFIIQGLSDHVIPDDAGQRLYDAAGEPRKLWTEADVDHLEMFRALPEEYEHRVVAFFDGALLRVSE